MGFSDLLDLKGFSHNLKLLKLTVNFLQAANSDRLQLTERDVAPLCVLKIIVEDDKAPEEIFSVKLGYVPFKAGDYIILDSGERGQVKEIGMRSTRILTRDDILISIPNSVITNVKIINESAPKPRLRTRIKVGVAYDTDVDQVEEILLDLSQNNPLVREKPKPRVRFRTFGDSSLEFELLCWAKRPHDKGRLIHELNRDIHKAFDSAGIVIPFPQRVIHTYSHPQKSSEE